LSDTTSITYQRLGSVLSEEVLGLVDAYVHDLVRRVVREELAASECLERRSWYSVDAAASRLGISPAAVRMRARRGRLETRRQGRRLYISAASVDELEPAVPGC
jgi:Helix-turn-helix domain